MSIILSALLAVRLSACLSIRLSVSRVDQLKRSKLG